MSDTAFLVLLVIIVMLGLMVVPQLFIRRAIPSVIKVFRQNNAVGIKNARTIDELGLKSQNIMDKMWKWRNYKPDALKILINVNIVQMSEDGKLYLSEENLAATKWNKY